MHSENILLAESSFVSGQHKPSIANGYALECSEKIDNMSPSLDGHAKVGISGSQKALSDLPSSYPARRTYQFAM